MHFNRVHTLWINGYVHTLLNLMGNRPVGAPASGYRLLFVCERRQQVENLVVYHQETLKWRVLFVPSWRLGRLTFSFL